MADDGAKTQSRKRKRREEYHSPCGVFCVPVFDPVEHCKKRIQDRNERRQNGKRHGNRKNPAAPHYVQKRHLRTDCARSLAVDFTENDDCAQRHERGGKKRGNEGGLRLLPRVHEYGRGEERVHSRIDRPARIRQNFARLYRIGNAEMLPAEAPNEEQKHGNENKVKQRYPLRSLLDTKHGNKHSNQG